LLRQSIHNAEADPDSQVPWIRQFAQEMDEQVLRKHIKTFVNEFSLDMGPLGRRAIDVLAGQAVLAGVSVAMVKIVSDLADASGGGGKDLHRRLAPLSRALAREVLAIWGT
jgi:predicted solute-binding protein